MPYTTEEGGRLNNFAVEPKVYEAAPPDKNQQRNYIIQAVFALLLIGGLVAVTISVSSMG